MEMFHRIMRIFIIFFEVLQENKYWNPFFYGYVNKVLGNKYGNSMKQGKLKLTAYVIKGLPYNHIKERNSNTFKH